MKKRNSSFLLALIFAATMSLLSFSCATQRVGCPGKITSAPVAAAHNG